MCFEGDNLCIQPLVAQVDIYLEQLLVTVWTKLLLLAASSKMLASYYVAVDTSEHWITGKSNQFCRYVTESAEHNNAYNAVRSACNGLSGGNQTTVTKLRRTGWAKIHRLFYYEAV